MHARNEITIVKRSDVVAQDQQRAAGNVRQLVGLSNRIFLPDLVARG
jgi:hypothetical protein